MGGMRGFAPHFKIARGPILKLNDYSNIVAGSGFHARPFNIYVTGGYEIRPYDETRGAGDRDGRPYNEGR